MNVKRADRSKVKTSVVRVRVTEAEAKMFRDKAKQYNCDTISQFIRMKCLNEDAYKGLKL